MGLLGLGLFGSFLLERLTGFTKVFPRGLRLYLGFLFPAALANHLEVFRCFHNQVTANHGTYSIFEAACKYFLTDFSKPLSIVAGGFV